MRSFSVVALLGAIVGIASAAAVPAPEANPDAEPFFHSLSLGYAAIPFIDKREAEAPTKVKRDPEAWFQNKDQDYFTHVPNPPVKTKRDITNIRPLLSRSWQDMLVQRTYPDTPTSGPDAGKCGALHGYACTGSYPGMCCGAEGSGYESSSMCGDTQRHCAGGCQRAYGYCTDPMFQIAFDADGGDVLWDPVTDNVFDANLGDGMLYYGYPLLDSETDDIIPWPSTV